MLYCTCVINTHKPHSVGECVLISCVGSDPGRGKGRRLIVESVAWQTVHDNTDLDSVQLCGTICAGRVCVWQLSEACRVGLLPRTRPEYYSWSPNTPHLHTLNSALSLLHTLTLSHTHRRHSRHDNRAPQTPTRRSLQLIHPLPPSTNFWRRSSRSATDPTTSTAPRRPPRKRSPPTNSAPPAGEPRTMPGCPLRGP